MKVNNINSTVQFKSKINIVSPKHYNYVVNTMSKDKNYHNIFEWLIRNDLSNNHKLNAFRTKVSQISTEEIRSCIAGFFVDNQEKIINLAFHLYDDLKNIEKLDVLNKYVKGSNGLLIGARSVYQHSLPIFENFEKEAETKKIPISIFKNFRGKWEGNIAYDSMKDEYYICIKDIQNPKIYVQNKYDLESAFSKYYISPNDSLEFL